MDTNKTLTDNDEICEAAQELEEKAEHSEAQTQIYKANGRYLDAMDADRDARKLRLKAKRIREAS